MLIMKPPSFKAAVFVFDAQPFKRPYAKDRIGLFFDKPFAFLAPRSLSDLWIFTANSRKNLRFMGSMGNEVPTESAQ